jgi:gliding motility-associated protein GldM
MGHGKETPRQKMIGMMYLVLTALLALNVSAEILNAFVLVDQSLRNTSQNFSKKNDVIYGNFEAAMQEEKTAAKAKKWKEIADKVKISSNELSKFMDDLKDKITSTAEGPESEYVKDPKRNPALVKSKDENNVPGQIMILEGKGKELKKKVEAYREELVKIIMDNTTEKNRKNFQGTMDGFRAALNTDDMIGNEGAKVPWEVGNFDHLPLSGVLTMLSKFQTDIRNAESEVLTFLWGNIEAGAWKFNKLEAIVVPSSNYVLVGGKYEAKVFIAASDSTQTPAILVGGRPLQVVDGKGVYTGGTGSIGFQKWGGVIKLESPATGEMLEFPFNTEYQVGAAGVTVSPTKMNVFYIGVPNPVSIAASGVAESALRVSMTNGTITKESGGYSVRVKIPGEAVINVSAEIDGATKSMGSAKFRVKRVPDPVAKIGGQNGGVIQKNALVAIGKVQAVMENFDFDLRFDIESYTVSTTVGGFEQEEKGRGANFNPKQIDLIRNVKPGRKVYFEDIKAKGPDGTIRNLGSITFKIQ